MKEIKKERDGHKESLQKGLRPHVKTDHQIHILQLRYLLYNNKNNNSNNNNNNTNNNKQATNLV